MQFTGSWWFVLLKRKETKKGGDFSKFDGMCKSLHNITSNKVPYRVRPSETFVKRSVSWSAPLDFHMYYSKSTAVRRNSKELRARMTIKII